MPLSGHPWLLTLPHVLMGSQVRAAAERRGACSCGAAFFPDAVDVDCPLHGLAVEVGAGRLGRAGADTPPEAS